MQWQIYNEINNFVSGAISYISFHPNYVMCVQNIMM